jgi:hypothetical protein
MVTMSRVKRWGAQKAETEMMRPSTPRYLQEHAADRTALARALLGIPANDGVPPRPSNGGVAMAPVALVADDVEKDEAFADVSEHRGWLPDSQDFAAAAA